MKKVLCTLILFILFICPGFSANWEYIGDNQYVDVDSITKDIDTNNYNETIYSVLFKAYRNESDDWNKLDKKILYIIGKYKIYCRKRITTLKLVEYYDYNGANILSFNYQNNEEPIINVPDDSFYSLLCK